MQLKLIEVLGNKLYYTVARIPTLVAKGSIIAEIIGYFKASIVWVLVFMLPCNNYLVVIVILRQTTGK